MRIIFAASFLFLFWFMLSGHTEILLVVLGIMSTLLSLFLARRMNVIDHESYPFHLSFKFLRYSLFLAKEIILDNIDVVKRIMKPGKTISPQVITLPANQNSDLGKVIYANSITLTPGTVTLELVDKQIKVHALSADGAERLKTNYMANQVPADKDGIS